MVDPVGNVGNSACISMPSLAAHLALIFQLVPWCICVWWKGQGYIDVGALELQDVSVRCISRSIMELDIAVLTARIHMHRFL